MDDLTRLRYEREGKQRKYWCEECDWHVIEGSICEELDDQPEGEPVPGRTGKIHIDPKRHSMQRDFLITWFDGKPSPTTQQFAHAARLATEHADKYNLETINELLAEFENNRPPATPHPVDGLPQSTPGKSGTQSVTLPPEMLQVLCDKIRAIIGEAIQRATKEVYNKEEAAEFLGISVSSVEKQGRLGTLRRSGNTRRGLYRREDLLAYAALTPQPPLPKKKRKPPTTG
jgi:hypothetical protein